MSRALQSVQVGLSWGGSANQHVKRRLGLGTIPWAREEIWRHVVRARHVFDFLEVTFSQEITQEQNSLGGGLLREEKLQLSWSE